jgi:hypothetical protein
MKLGDIKPGNTKREEMTCEEAVQFVSALCDREIIPPAAAEHIGVCAACHERLQEYIEMGAELRRVASLQAVEETEVKLWEQVPRITSKWWGKGWETMRIPRFAFAILLVAAVVLGSSLVMVKARAHTQGPVLMLTAKSATGHTVRCALSLKDEKADSCGSVRVVNGGAELFGFRVISDQGDRIEIGVRARFLPGNPGSGSFSSAQIDGFPETTYWLQVGEKLEAKVEGSDPMTITGELLDHMPTSLSVGGDEQLEPNPTEVRFVAPVFVRGKEVVADFEGMTVKSIEKDHGIVLHVPHDGRYLVSLSPLEGAVEGQIKESRVTFELNGQPYEFLTGAPIARGSRIWILHLPNEETPDKSDEHEFVSSAPMTQYLAKAPAKN